MALFGALDGLPAAQRRQLEVVATGKNPLSVRAREQLGTSVETQAFRALAPAEKYERIKAAFNKSVGDTVAVDEAVFQKGRRSEPGTAGRPVVVKNFDFEVAGFDHSREAKRVDLTVNGRTIPVYGPVDGKFATRGGAQALTSHSLEDIGRALSLLRKEDLARVKDVRLSPVPNPQDAMWARLYGEKGFSSYMNAGPDGVVTIFPWKAGSDDYTARGLAANLGHELGHVASNGAWGPGRGAGRQKEWAQWEAAGKADGLRASVYAKSSVEEDLAETDALRKLALGTPYAAELSVLFPNRMAMLDRHFPVTP